MASKQLVELGGRHLSLTNLDKVLYPGTQFTKAHVIDYYARIAGWLLPHFRERPVTLLRFPDGVHGKTFYEKDAPKHTPPWIPTTMVPRQSGGKPIRYVCVNDAPTLVWCANLASLELHPFLHRAGELDCPSSVVFDLDPGEGADLSSCARVALLVRETLAGAGVDCFAKVSGSKGLQVYAPLNTKVTYEQTRSFAQSVAQKLEKQHPALIVSAMAKERRASKVFIDWGQNADFKTTIGVYSLRAKNDVPYVSAPVTWEELESLHKRNDEDSLRFTPEALLKRVEEIGDLFAPLLTLRQHLPTEKELASASKVTALAAKPGKTQKARTAAVARFVEPMLLLRTEELPEGPNWCYELKLDGYRAIAIKTGGEVFLRSRNDNDFNSRYPAVAEALFALPDETVIDGEVVAMDSSGRPSFNALQNLSSSRAPIFYFVFDVLVLAGRDVTSEPLSERREVLQDLLANLGEPIRQSPQLNAGLAEVIGAVRAQGLEGIVAKRLDSRYESGQRSGAWRKMRINRGQEFVIGGYSIGGKHFDALIFGYYQGDELMYAARTRNGFTPASREQLFRRFRGLATDVCPFVNLPQTSAGRWGQGLTAEKMEDCRWLKPELVGQFEFVEWTPEGHLRHSKFVALREDKDPRTVVREDQDDHGNEDT
jgi:bifunctional non-homologous end joining protein LigD